MDTSASIKKKVDRALSNPQPTAEEVIVVSQMQNLLKMRLLEAFIAAIPAATARRFILPRFGFVVRRGLQGGMLDSLVPGGYLYYTVNKDRYQLAKLVGIDEQTRIDKDSVEQRARFVNQFWSNSQYWH